MPRYYTDDWGAYERHLDTAKHQVGKRNTQKIELKNLNPRTWIKRLTRKTICFSKSALMYDTVIGLLINKLEFGVDIHAKLQVWPATKAPMQIPNGEQVSRRDKGTPQGGVVLGSLS